jgi:hypothetical protein
VVVHNGCLVALFVYFAGPQKVKRRRDGFSSHCLGIDFEKNWTRTNIVSRGDKE